LRLISLRFRALPEFRHELRKSHVAARGDVQVANRRIRDIKRTADAQRPLADRVEVAAPSFVAIIARVVARLPAPLRRRLLNDVFARAEAAFNRGDFEAIFALFAEDVHYVPPPALGEGAINGRAAVLAFWQAIATRFGVSTIQNLSVEEVTPRRFVRTARITHRTDGDELSYAIRQVTEVCGGRAASQINEQISES
jgi:ketosteroid isomerase-like protein